ncbi:uncharacterized protein LOC121987140, partial [Zingiber officinale]|uniref:uncharacterized protein LOC121987140 n=1 Tax=Zingiber officinale TaxID=94328 RepID=UPI001C4C3C71
YRYIISLVGSILKLHGNGILLLNLKPGNFLLDKNNEAVIGDFGIPLVMHGLSLPSSDLIQRLDTPNYMAKVMLMIRKLKKLKDQLQAGDTVCPRKARNLCNSESMENPISEGIIVGKGSDDYLLIRVHGMAIHNPLRVHYSTMERVTYGFVVGDWVRASDEDKKCSLVGILHSIERDGKVTVGFIGMDTLWHGHYSELQIAESHYTGQFLKVKSSISTPRFEWPHKPGGEWATGKVSKIHPNGYLVVKFPGRFSFGEASNYLADPSEVEVVNFKKCEGLLKKYQHLEDFHWAVRPLVIAFGLFTALKLGSVAVKSTSKSGRKKTSKFDPLHLPEPMLLCLN